MKYRSWVLAAIIYHLSSLAYAESPLTLKDCFLAALKQSEIMADQQEQIQQAEERYRQAQAALWPNLTLYGSYMTQQESESSSSNQSLVKLTLLQPLFRGFREYAALRQTQATIEMQKEARQWAGLQLYSDVSDAFYTVLAVEADLLHVEAQLKLYAQRIQDLSSRVQIGRSRASEVLAVKSAQAILQAQFQTVLAQRDMAREMLAFLTGLAPDIALSPVSGLPTAIDPLEAYLRDLETRPDARAAQKKLEAAAESIRIARGGHWPSLDASANYYPVRSGSMEDVRWDAQVALTLPLFSGFAVTSKTREAESQYRQTQLAWDRLQRLNQTQVKNAYTQLQSDLAQAQAWEEASTLAHKNYLAVARDYNLGLTNTLDVLQAMATDQDTLRSWEKIRYTVWVDTQRLEALCARCVALMGEQP